MLMRRSFSFSSLFSLLSLAIMLPGCAGVLIGAAVASRPLPIVSVTQYDTGREMVLSGQLGINIDMTSRAVMSSADETIRCSADIDRRGQGVLTCTGGVEHPINIPSDQFGTLSGAYTERGNGYVSAVGWGDGADSDRLRGMIR